MGTTSYYETDHFPPNSDGLADETKTPTKVELLLTTFYGNHQIFLRLDREASNSRELHFTKEQAKELGEALIELSQSIQYDNSIPPERE